MPATLANEVFDNGLNYIDTNATHLYLCNAQPTTYIQASDTYKLGVKTPITVSAPADGDTSGRKVTISQITDGTVDGTGDVTFYAITSGSVLIATGVVSPTASVTTGNTFQIGPIDIELPDPA